MTLSSNPAPCPVMVRLRQKLLAPYQGFFYWLMYVRDINWTETLFLPVLLSIKGWKIRPPAWSRVSTYSRRASTSCTSWLTTQSAKVCTGREIIRLAWKGHSIRIHLYIFFCLKLPFTTAAKPHPIITDCSVHKSRTSIYNISLREEDCRTVVRVRLCILFGRPARMLVGWLERHGKAQVDVVS